MRLAHPFGADTFIYILNKLVTFSLYCPLVLDSVCLPSFFSLISKHCICILHSKESRCYKTDPYFSQMMAKITNNRLWRLNKKNPCLTEWRCILAPNSGLELADLESKKLLSIAFSFFKENTLKDKLLFILS